MNRQSIRIAFVTFLRDLLRASFICHIIMVGSIGIFCIVGKTLAKYLALTGKPNLQIAGWLIAVELTGFWLVAFALGVKIRPAGRFHEYPPYKMMEGAFAVLLQYGLIVGIISGCMMGFGILKSILYNLLSLIATTILIILLFVPTIHITLAAIRLRGDPGLATADAYRNTWLFSALASLIVGLLLKWMAGEQPGLTPYFIAMNSSLITAVTYTGFASGYYP